MNPESVNAPIYMEVALALCDRYIRYSMSFFAGVLFPILEAVLTVEEACNEDTTFFSSSEL